MASTTKVVREIPSFIRIYNDGSVERLWGSPYVPPSFDNQEPPVSSKDITISESPNITARLYLPNQTQPRQKLPILVYFHGGGFCLESAFSFLDQRYLNTLVSEGQVVAVSVEYRLAPETPLPGAYQDCWDALNWVASKSDPWISEHGDFDRIFIGGDSAGGNIVHNIALRIGVESLNEKMKIVGGFLSHPYFLGSKAVGNEDLEKTKLAATIWELAYPSAAGGVDNPLINPMGEGAPALEGLGCRKLLVCVAEKDELRDRGVWYYEMVKQSGWEGEVELFEVEGEGHAFHIFDIHTENAKKMIKRLASFISSN